MTSEANYRRMNLVLRFISKSSEARPVLLASLCFFVLVACSKTPDQRVLRLEGRTMGTTYHITAVADPSVTIAEPALQMEIDKDLENFNQVMSTYISDSELSMLNQEPVGTAMVVSQKLFDILTLSRKISVFTEGAFDITVGPLVNLWGFGPDEMEEKAPDAAKIASALATVGYEHVQLDAAHRQVTRLADVYVDLSAIAKGYGADEVAELLHSHGIENYMVEVGGELVLAGNNPAGKPWRIGIEQPTLAKTGVSQAIAIGKGGIATSGDYRNYFEVNGQRFSHTIDPATGRPITHALASITIVAPTSGEADALATAINVMGPEKGYAFAVKHGLPAYFIIRHGDGFVSKSTPEFEQYKVKL